MNTKNFNSVAIMVIALAFGLSSCNGMDTIDPDFEITSAGTITFTSAAGPQTLTLTSNAKWSVKSSASWLTLSSTSGLGDATITVTTTANTTGATRTATLTFTVSGLPNRVISVSQAPASYSIAVTATGLDNLKVDQNVTNAKITYTLTGGTYAATITPANFAVSNLPPGLTANTAQRTNNTEVTITIGGSPTTANTSTRNITRPSSIAAANVSGASSAISVSGTLTVGAIVLAPSIAVTATGLDNLKVDQNVTNAKITYTLTGGTYAATIDPADFAVTRYPLGFNIATAQRISDTEVTITVSGAPYRSSSEPTIFGIKQIIAAANIVGASSYIRVPADLTVGGPIAKATGATVATPTAMEITASSIEVHKITIPPSNNPGGQPVVYGLTTNTSPEPSVWQVSPVFSGLNPNTTYYIWARALEHETYEAGVAQRAAIKTLDRAIMIGVQSDFLVAGTATDVYFPVALTGSSNQSYQATVQFTNGSGTPIARPTGTSIQISVFQTDPVTKIATATVEVGITNAVNPTNLFFTVTVGGITSLVRRVQVLASTEKAMIIGNPSRRGTDDGLVFPIRTRNIPPSSSTELWMTDALGQVIPSNIQMLRINWSEYSDGSQAHLALQDSSMPAGGISIYGTHIFKITISGVTRWLWFTINRNSETGYSFSSGSAN